MIDIGSHLIVISGPSGAGKDTVVSELLKTDDRLTLSVSATTRKPRGKEIDGVDYFFLSPEKFESLLESDGFVESAVYGSNRYGTLKSDVSERISAGKTVILVIDVQGGESIKKKYPKALSVFIMPPSREILEKRLRGRLTDSEEAIARRLEIAVTEIEKASNYDYTVVNDNLDDCVKKVYNIIVDYMKKGGETNA